MSRTASGPTARRPLFTWAAWLSLIVPLVTTAFYLSVHAPQQKLPKWIWPAYAAVFGACLVSGCVSLFGVRANGVWAIVPAAVLGILVSVALGLLALIFWALSGLPGP